MSTIEPFPVPLPLAPRGVGHISTVVRESGTVCEIRVRLAAPGPAIGQIRFGEDGGPGRAPYVEIAGVPVPIASVMSADDRTVRIRTKGNRFVMPGQIVRVRAVNSTHEDITLVGEIAFDPGA